MKVNKLKALFNAAVLMSVAIISAPAMADGFNKANSLLQKIATGLTGLAIVTITIAATIVGYRVLFDGQALRDSKNVMIGGIIIASVAEIASMLMS